MNREKIQNKIKELNSLRARCQHDFNEIKKKHDHHEISDKEFQKHENRFHKHYEKLHSKIHDLEHKLNEMKEK